MYLLHETDLTMRTDAEIIYQNIKDEIVGKFIKQFMKKLENYLKLKERLEKINDEIDSLEGKVKSREETIKIKF